MSAQPHIANCNWDSLPAEIVEEIVDWTNLRDRSMLRGVNHTLFSVVQARFRTGLEGIFALGNLELSHMIDVLRSTEAVISGSSVLLLLNPETFIPGDLDIYVDSSHASQLMKALREKYPVHEGTPPPSKPSMMEEDYDNLEDIQDIYTLINGDKKINLVVGTDSAITPIFHFHSSVVMNFISADAVYCAYPELTFNWRNMVNSNVTLPADVVALKTFRERAKLCLEKYRDRGYEARRELTWKEFEYHNCKQEWSCPRTRRNTWDKGGFTLPIHCMLGKTHMSSKKYRSRFELWSLEQPGAEDCKVRNIIVGRICAILNSSSHPAI
ncbi:hypothetical protein DXG01_006401 [Tephrocybe rancida]|nr:hypothetical protein DXG01_006401 [Tephrocybe rancida]